MKTTTTKQIDGILFLYNKKTRLISFKAMKDIQKKFLKRQDVYYFIYNLDLEVLNHDYCQNMTNEIRIAISKVNNTIKMLTLYALSRKTTKITEKVNKMPVYTTYKICKSTGDYQEITTKENRIGFINKTAFYYISECKSIHGSSYAFSEESEITQKLYSQIKSNTFDFKNIIDGEKQQQQQQKFKRNFVFSTKGKQISPFAGIESIVGEL